MARNFAVKKVRKQMYPGSFNNMDEVDGESGTDIDWVDTETGNDSTYSATIVSAEDGHRKVIKFLSAGDNNLGCFWNHNISQSADGTTIELWMKYIDYGDGQYRFMVHGTNAGNLILIYFNSNDNNLYYSYGDGVGGTTTDTTAVVADIWYHIRVEIDFTNDTFELWLNNTKLVDAENFYDDRTDSEIDYYRLRLYDANGLNSMEGYVDAIGESWDTDYKIGDNVFWRHYTESTDEFEGDDVGTQGTTITWVDVVDTAASVEIIAEFNEHKKILRQDYTSAAGGYDYCQHTFATQAKAGWFAFWIKAADITGSNQIRLNEDATLISNFAIRTSQFQKYSGGAWSQVTGSPVPVNDTWYLVYLKITDAATDTIDCWIGNILYETYNAQANETAGVNNVQIRSYGVGEYVYIDAPISSLDGDIRADNRIFDYNDAYTREVITTLVKNVITSNILHVWRTGTLYSETVYYYDEVFFQIYDVNSKLGMEADLTNRIQHDSLYHYPLEDKNADDLVNESSNTFAADDIHDPTDSTCILKVILPNVSEADGDLILVDADTKTDTYSPVTKNYPDYMMLRDISDIADSVVIIAADGKCYLDDDKDSGDSLDLDTAADKLIMTRPPIPNDIVGVNYFVIKGAMNPDTGTRFYKVVDNSGTDKKNTFRITNNQLRSQTDVDAYAAKIAAKLIAVKEIIIETQGLGVHNMGETFNYKYVNAVHNIPQKDYYIIKEDFDYDLAAATIKLSEGLSEKSKYAQRFERAEDYSDTDMSEIYETDINTVSLALYPDGGGSQSGAGIQLNAANELGRFSFFVTDTIDPSRDITIYFTIYITALDADSKVNMTFSCSKITADCSAAAGAAFLLDAEHLSCVTINKLTTVTKTIDSSDVINNTEYYGYAMLNDAAPADVILRNITIQYYIKRSV